MPKPHTFIKVFLLVSLLFLYGCEEKSNHSTLAENTEQRDSVTTPLTREAGKLKVLMDNNIASYYILKGQPRGFDYELLSWYCKDHNLELEVEVIPNFDFILDSLLVNRGDIAAGNLTITGDRLRRVQFTTPLHYTRQVLVQRLTPEAKQSRAARKEWLVDHILELEGKEVYVNRTSSFADRLYNIVRENGIQFQIEEVPAEIGYSRLIEMVSEGLIDLTVADENIARMHRAYYSNLDINTPISLTQAIAWALPPDKDSLKNSLNTWLDSKVNTTRYNIIYNKYFSSNVRRNQSIREIRNGRISAYDNLIQQKAEDINWDWRLLAALIHQESRFNPDAQSAFGATGLMQVMPATGARFGVEGDDLFLPSRNMQAGTGLIVWLEKYWLRKLEDTTDIKKFILASYNVGLGHVIDARNLADKYEMDSEVWYDNVEVMLKNKMTPKYYNDTVVDHGYCRGSEPVHYVRSILKTYQYYVQWTNNNQRIDDLAQVSHYPSNVGVELQVNNLEGEVYEGL